ncbi:DUF748 domain-containing protein [Candidatus Uabimicrobium amorphum]|uniref:Chromosome partition protein Smc n=1 Tax=Uabimicrobium amorphum TaxID=2596890 RepID=A0A5S9IR49_UABAM|nr:hypothetical protein [Candidatus Uabimicrobium amorphum]BBM86050.1 chromosome partition protein Smc [Candidatus Uabimicrobium amorphum]
MTEEVKVQKTKKRRRLWLKIPLYTLLFIIVLIAFLPLYSGLFVATIVDVVEQKTGRKAQIESLSVNVFGGSVYVGGVLLKEDKSENDFVKVDKVEFDIAILSLIFGNINIANAEVSGVDVHVVKGKDGKFNFQSILDNLASVDGSKPAKNVETELPQQDTEKDTTKQPSSDSNPVDSLRSLGVKVTLADINFHYEDLQQNSSFALKKLNFFCNVAGLDNIGYQSNWEKAQFESQNGKEVSAGLVYSLSGNAGVAAKKGKLNLYSKGSLSFLDMYAKGLGDKDVENTNLKVTHDFSVDMASGVCSLNDLQLESDYLNVKGSSVKIDKLDTIIEHLQDIAKNDKFGDKEAVEKFIQALSFENWSGNFSVSFDLDQVKTDFGKSIMAAVNKNLQKQQKKVLVEDTTDYSGDGLKELSDFGGKFNFEVALSGKEKAVNINEKFNIAKLFVAGKSQKGKDVRINFDKIAQTFNFDVGFEKENAQAKFELGVHPTQKTTLLKISFDSSFSNILDKGNLKVNKSSQNVFIDFDVLSNIFADFLPPQTSLHGKFDNKDWISQLSDQKMEIGGSTEIYAHVKSPKTKDLPPFHLTGKRSFFMDFDANKILKKVTIKDLNFQTKGSDILELKGKGNVSLAGNDRNDLQVKLAVNLGGLEPYIKPFIPGLQPRGKIQHITRVAKKGDKVKIAGNGGIRNLAFVLQSTPYSIPKADWKHDIVMALQDNQPTNVEIRTVSFKHEALQLNVHGAIKDIVLQPLSFSTGKVKVKNKGKTTVTDGIDIRVDGDLEKIPYFVREMAKSSGVHLQKLRGKFLYNTRLQGNLDELKIRNKILYRGDLAIRLQDGEKFLPTIESNHGVDSDIQLVIKDLGKFNEKKAPLNIEINPKSHFGLNKGKAPLLYSRLSGTISKDQQDLQLNNLSVKVLGHGKQIQDSIPVNFIAKNDASLRKMLREDLKIDGKFNINTTLNGSPQNLTVEFSKDFTPFILKFTDAQKGVLVDKKSDFALAYATEIHLQKQDTQTSIDIKNSVPKLGRTKIKMGNLAIVQQQDDLHITAEDGKSPATVINIEELPFSELSAMLPIIETLKLQNAKLQFEIGNLVMHKKAQDISGKLFGRITIPEIDLPHIQKVLGTEKKPVAKEDKPAPVTNDDKAQEDTNTETDEHIVTLPQEVRDMLRKFIVDFKIIVDKAQIDELNTAKDFTVTAALNEKEANNMFMFDVNGQTNDGKLSVTAQANLDKEHPECKFTSDIEEMSYTTSLFGSVTERLNSVVPFPLFNKINFAEGDVVKFSFKGENVWTGLDPRVIKKSLLSNGETSLKISGGKFDLGFDMSNFVDLDSIKQELEAQIAPLKSQLSQLQTNLTGGKGSVSGLQETLTTLTKNIQPTIDKKRETEGLINSLSEKLKYTPQFLRGPVEKQLKNTQKYLSTYDTEIAEYEEQKGKLETQIAGWQKKISGYQQQITDMQNNIQQKQESLMSKLKIDDPFAFDFGSLYIAFKVTNDSPYQGNSNNWSSHPFSKVNYVEVSFTPKGKPFPALKGWCSLDGTYDFQFKPAEEFMENLKQKAPFLANFIEKENGVSWGSSGFKPSPVNK